MSTIKQLIKKLKLFPKIQSAIQDGLESTKAEIMEKLKIKIGSTVNFANGFTPKQKREYLDKETKKSIKEPTTIDDIRINEYTGEIVYTLAWRDNRGMRWCFTEDELTLIK